MFMSAFVVCSCFIGLYVIIHECVCCMLIAHVLFLNKIHRKEYVLQIAKV